MSDTSGSGFAGKVVLITGGASGIGRASAEAFARLGASVMVADRDEVHGDVVVAAIRASGGQARFVRVDVAEPDQIRAMVDAVEEEYGRLDVAVNNAGTPGTYKAFSDQLLDDWQRTLAVNLTGVFLSMQAEIPAMLDVGRGAIVNVSSAATASARSPLMSSTATRAPSAAMARTTAAPMPPPPPVTIACWPSSEPMSVSSSAQCDEADASAVSAVSAVGRVGQVASTPPSTAMAWPVT